MKTFSADARVAIPWGFRDAAPLEGIATLVRPVLSTAREDNLVPWMVRFEKDSKPVMRFLKREWIL